VVATFFFGRSSLTGDLHLLTDAEYRAGEDVFACTAHTLEEACAIARKNFLPPTQHHSEMDELKKRADELLNGDRR
jgi:hypothetical protein